MSRTTRMLRSADRREDRRQAVTARAERDTQDERTALASWWQDDPRSGDDN